MYTHKFIKIIVEKQDDLWSAWLEHDPQTAFSAESPAPAIMSLVNYFGQSRFALDGMVPIDEARTDSHLEFIILMRGLRPIPTPSVN